jgi:hypothetical protein
VEPITDDLLLPVGTRVLHIGPHKTGTTTVQFAFHGARPALAAQRVFYPGPNSQPMYAVYAVTGRMPDYVRGVPLARWRELVGRLKGSTVDRAVISSEGFCDANDEAIRRIARDLDPRRVHVVVTLRPLGALLASQWQQSVQDGRTHDYESWLRMIFREPDSTAARAFWHRHRHDRLVERWARVFGPERVSVVVVDDRDHEAVLRIFERLVGLEPGTLRGGHTRTNRSLTRPEIEVVRAMNQAFRGAGVDPDMRVRIVRDGAGELLKLRRPEPDEPRISTPAWAREAAEAAGREIVAGIAGLRVRVVGDLARLAPPPATPTPATLTPEPVAGTAPAAGALAPAAAAEVAAAGPLAVLIMAGLARKGGAVGDSRPGTPMPGGDGWAEPIRRLDLHVDSATISTAQIRRTLLGRTRRGVAARLPALAALVRWIRSPRRRRGDARPEVV